MTLNQSVELLKGELALPDAPATQLTDGKDCIPQHYLTFNHDLGSVEEVIFDVFYDERFPIFVSQDEAGIYLQVGIIGEDNYTSSDKEKLVYGRKWRVEPNLPTSEIIQTAFLAIKTAREHEIRELVQFHDGKHVTTPFNSHHDLPLLTQCKNRLQSNTKELIDIQCMTDALAKVHYAGVSFVPTNLVTLDDDTLVLSVGLLSAGKSKLPELNEKKAIQLVLESRDENHLLHTLMCKLIDLSDRHVSENFKFRSFARFSWDNQVSSIAEISAQTRQLHRHPDSAQFAQRWRAENFEVDYSRAPALKESRLTQKIRQQLDNLMPLDGHLPLSFNQAN